MIVRGGQNIYPKEIEDLLFSHPRVTQAVVIGIPDPVMGERACACVTPVKGQDFTFEEMSSFLKGQGLAIHKLPERLEVMEEFPQLVDGQKIDKISLKNMILNKITPSPTLPSPRRRRYEPEASRGRAGWGWMFLKTIRSEKENVQKRT